VPDSSTPAPSTPARSSLGETQLASMAAGLVTRLVLHPFDTAKTRLQHLRGGSAGARLMGVSAASGSGAAIAGFLRAERVAGLYRGVVGALVGVLPYSAIYMPSYELAQRSLGQWLGPRHLLGTRHVVAGAAAGLCGSIVKTPVDVVKKRVQAGLHRNVVAALVAVFADVPASAGVRPRVAALYTGWRSAILYDIPYNAIQFSILEMVKGVQCRLEAMRGGVSPARHGAAGIRRIARGENGAGRVPVSGTQTKAAASAASARTNIVIGACTGALTSLVTEPFDVVKTRMMTQRSAATLRSGVTYYQNWRHAMVTIVREEGVPALWKGSIPRLVWVAGSGALWYGTYATVRQYLHHQRPRRQPSHES
jgi:hypothetical protein